MKVTYPLSLKVSVWLLLNLMLLAASTVGFFVVKGGLGLDALLVGPAGDHAQAKASVIAGEFAAATVENRPAVLARFADAHKVDLLMVRGEEIVSATALLELPPAVRSRVEPRLSRKGPGPRPERAEATPATGDPLPRATTAEPARATTAEAEPPRRVERTEPGPTGPTTVRLEPPFDFSRERERLRFIIRSDAPAGYWLGMRVPFLSFERGRFRGPTTLIARVDSFWALLGYLELRSWVFAGMGMMAMSVLFWLPLVHSITRSISQLTRATEKIAEGRFDTRVASSRRDELGNLGDSVNRMAERLDAHMTGQRRFLGDVAHELCSPLARLQMVTGILSEHAPAALQENVSDLREEVQQMSTLVNELLAFTKAGLKPREVVCAPVDLEPLAREVLAREDSSGSAKLSIPAGLRANAERDLLMRALGNLVRNAVRYAGAAGPIVVTARRDDRHVAIIVEDEGPGVPPAALDRLGEPFFRPDEARTREGGGVGLGLAIVRNSVAACGGEVRFANLSPRGFRAEIRLTAAG